MYHDSVLLKESVDALSIKPNGVYVDVTFGGGGHSREILKQLDKGKLIAFDQDPEAKKNAIDDPRFTLVDQNFRYMKNWVKLQGHQTVDGILGDLGVSSHQFDSRSRGFSIRFDAALDMRMDMKGKLTASDIVNEYEENQLISILRMYGEVDHARAIARSIISARPVLTSGELKKAIERHLMRGKEHKLLAQVFQALRIEVNGELDVLKELLTQSAEILNSQTQATARTFGFDNSPEKPRPPQRPVRGKWPVLIARSLGASAMDQRTVLIPDHPRTPGAGTHTQERRHGKHTPTERGRPRHAHPSTS